MEPHDLAIFVAVGSLFVGFIINSFSPRAGSRGFSIDKGQKRGQVAWRMMLMTIVSSKIFTETIEHCGCQPNFI